MYKRRGRQQYIASAILFVLLLSPVAIEAQSGNSDCLACHGDKDLVTTDSTGVERSLYVDATQMENSVHAGFECVTCHVDVAPASHPDGSRLARATCGTCHENAVTEVGESVHGKASLEGEALSDAPTCGDCHGSHEIRATADSLSSVNQRQLAFTCARCHANPAIVQKYHIPIKDPFTAYSRSVHGRLTIAGIDSAATCSSCHGNHKIFASNNPASKVFHFNIPQTCGQCHQAIMQEYNDSVHGVAVARGSTDSPVCTDCHTEHGIESPKVATAPTAPRNVAVETCGRCHASTRIVEKYGMRAERLSTFADSYHGLALRSGRLSVANCGSCHGVHNILPSSDPRSMIHPSNLAATCGTCHPNAGENFTRGPVHMTMEEKEGKTIAVIRFIYMTLIIVVIGGMFIHNALDFVRKSKQALRRE
ncbi:MAG: cytochrome c3 family protein [candidate division KSB1 bacterium]|nr:cytochrome c3 family protein [candidate division KSB1 bacterium]MDZ7367599.1 cytochrome c3 family protein [candidate division KSB1 bacterium]MDZ7405391.1 cytochrome c3 family protein [candidate division KSB1 bacterium]